jgi:hypothetical protein
MIIKGEKPKVYSLKREGTSVLLDGSSILQGEDITSYWAVFIAWDKASMLAYLDALEAEASDRVFTDLLAR